MRIAVVMSTYNGEPYLEEQVQSILGQLPAEGWLLVRDDGSRDGTVRKLQALDDPRVRILAGENVGYSRSFLTLLSSVPPETEMVMLSDQDDVWLPGKIQRAWDHLARVEGPGLYCSRQRLVDAELRPISCSAPWPRGASFANALAENIVTGCTAALNAPALRLVTRCGDASRIQFHDWWMYLVVSAFGTVITDPEPTLLYRQHGRNVIGRGPGWRVYLVNLRFIVRRSWVHIMYSQIQNFRATHGAALAPGQRRLVEDYFDPCRAGSVLRLLFVPRRFRQKMMDELLLRLLIVAEVIAGRGLVAPQVSLPNT